MPNLEPFAQSASWSAQSLGPYAQKANAETKISNPVLKRRLERQKSRTLSSKVRLQDTNREPCAIKALEAGKKL